MARESIKRVNPHCLLVGGTVSQSLLLHRNLSEPALGHDELVEILRLARVGYDAEKKEREELEEALLKRGLNLVEMISNENNAALLNITTEDLKAIQFFVYTFKKLHCEKT